MPQFSDGITGVTPIEPYPAQEMVNKPRQTRNEKFQDLLTMSVPAAVAGAVDTFGTSLGLLDDDDIQHAVKSINEDFGRFYEENRGAARIAGELATFYIPGKLAVKAWQGAGKLYEVSKLPRGLKTAGSLFASTKYADRLQRLVQMRDLQLAARGVNPASEIYKAGSMRNRAKLASLYKQARTKEMVQESVAFELGILGTMNSSDFFYPEEFSVMDHAAFALAPIGVFAGIDRAIGARVLRKSLQGVSEIYQKTRSPNLTTPIFPHPGNRDVSLTTAALARKYADDIRADATFLDQRTVFGRDVGVFETEIRKQIDGLAKDNYIPGLTKKDALEPGVTRGVFDNVREDPGIMVGALSIENLPDFKTMNGFYKQRDKTVKNLEKMIAERKKQLEEGVSEANEAKLRMEIEDLDNKRITAQGSDAYVLEADGALVPAVSRKPMFQDSAQNVKYYMPVNDITTAGVWRTVVPADEVAGGSPVTLTWTRNGTLGTGSAKTFDDLTFYQQTAAYDLMRRAVDKFMDSGAELVLTPKDHYTKFDYVTELFAKYGKDIFNNGRVQLDKTFGSIDDVVYTGLVKKFEQYAKKRNNVSKIKVPETQKLTPRELAIAYNLPGPPNPIVNIFEELRAVETDLTKVGGLVEFKHLVEREIGSQYSGAFTGGMLRYPTQRQPAYVVKRALPENSAGEYVRLGQEAHYMQTLNILQNGRAYGGNLVASLMDEMTRGISAPLAKAARATDSIMEGGQRGTGTVWSQQMAGGEMSAMQAVHTFDEVSTKAYRALIARLFEQPAKVFGRLRQNTGATEAFNHYIHMRRQGWDLADDVVEMADGKFAFQLADTPSNHERFIKRFGRDFKRGELAPGATRDTYNPLVVDEIALEAAQQIDALDEIYLANTNVIRHAMGKKPLTRKAWHVPPKNFAGKEIAYVVDNDTGKVVQVVSGTTETNAVTAAESLISKGDIKNARVIKQNEMRAYFDIRDEAFAEMADWTDAARQTGPAKGTTAKLDVVETGPGVLQDIVKTQENHFNSILHRTRMLYFEPQLQFAEQMIARESAAGRQAGHTAWQQYSNAVLGQRALNREAKFDKLYFAVEEYVDNKLAALHDKFAAGRTSVRAVKNPDAAYEAMKQSLGEFTPFTDAADYARRTYNVSQPWSMKQLSNKATWVTGLLALRIFDVSHAVLTLTSLGATMPGVIKALQPIAGETAQETANRIGAYGHFVPEVQQGTFSATKAMMRGIHSMWTPQGRAILKKASEQGLIAQPIAEMMETLAKLEGGISAKFLDRMGRYVTAISDESEKLARGVSFMTGYNLAKDGLKISDDNLAMAFAHRFANETIGNYNPNNRPRMFQGAVGMPLGLFMTFMQNYYQRLFGYIENKQTRAAVVQLASQASVFGGQTVPGFQQYVDYFASNYDGSVDPVQTFRENFGDDASNLIFYGALSNLPKLFGADDGIALYQRGDVNVRSIPTLVTPQNTPIVSVWGDVLRMGGQVLSQMKERNGLSAQQTAEIMGAYSPNRMLRSAGQLYTSAASGHVVDRRGAVVSADTELGMSTVARLLGFRPLSEAHANEQYYAVRASEAARSAKMEDLRATVRADIRSGDFSESSLKRAVSRYVQYGGSPEYFVRWYREQLFASQVDRSLLKLKETLSNPNKMKDIFRLMSALQMAPVDPEFSE